MNKIRYRLLIAWKALTAPDLFIVAFNKDATRCEVISASDRDEIDALASSVAALLKYEMNKAKEESE